jgi:hypothetical protein
MSNLICSLTHVIAKLTADQSSDLGANTEDDGETDFATDNATMLHLEPIDLRSVNIVSRQLSGIESARTRVQSEMENMVMSGLDKLVSEVSRHSIPLRNPLDPSLLRTSLSWRRHYKLRSICGCCHRWSLRSLLI